MNQIDLLEIELNEREDFLKIAESLTRIGIPSVREGVRRLFQSCHILHKRGRYYIVHFKEMFALDGKMADMSEEDVLRRNTVAVMLEDWGLCRLVQPKESLRTLPRSSIKVIKFAEKPQWILQPKYSIGRR